MFISRWGRGLRISIAGSAILLAGLLGAPAPSQAQPGPTLSLTKTADQTSFTGPGQTLTYTYTVTNNHPFNQVVRIAITDSNSMPVCPDTSFPPSGNELDPGETITCTSSYTTDQGDIDFGGVSNSATASGDECTDGCNSTTGTQSETVFEFVPFERQPSLTITKTPNPDNYDAAGDIITYTYEVENDGNVLIDEIVIEDDLVGPVICDDTELDPGQTTTCEGTYEIQEPPDIENGSVTNTARAVGNFCTAPPAAIEAAAIIIGECTVASDNAQAIVFLQERPSLAITKTPEPDNYDAAGDLITYTYQVTNDGNVPLVNITVADNRVEDITCDATELDPGESTECTGTYETSDEDVANRRVENTATANGQRCTEGCIDVTSPEVLATIFLQQRPALTLTKDANPTTYDSVGDVITYSYEVTNTGNVPLSAIQVDDDRATVTCLDTTLAPSESTTCSAQYVIDELDITAGEVTNTAVAQGDSCGEGCIVTSPPVQETVTFERPPSGSITIVKLTDGGDGAFGFSTTNEATPDFMLATVGGSAATSFEQLAPGIYGFTETDLPTGWELVNLTCTGDGANGENGNGGTPTNIDLANRTVTIGLDPGEEIACSFTNARDHVPDTLDLIHNFLRNRLEHLANEDPDRARIFRRLSGAIWGTADQSAASGGADSALAFTGETTDSTTNIAVATSLLRVSQAFAALHDDAEPMPNQSFDLWLEAHFQGYEDDGGTLNADGYFGILYLGADYLITPSFLVGGLVQFDWQGQDVGAPESRLEGAGWLAGPYVSARLTPNLFFDARAAWGTSENTVSPFNLYTDEYQTDRWLASANLTGNWNRGNFRITPSLGVTYVEEHQHSYTDTLGALIPEQTLSLGRASFGPEFAYRFLLDGGTTVEPQLGVQGLWDFDSPGGETVAGLSSTDDDLRAMMEAGLLTRFHQGASMRLVGTYDGLGSDYQSYGGQLWVSVPLQ